MKFKVIDLNGNLRITATTGTLPDPVTVIHGGTGLTADVQGDIFYADASNSMARLAKDTNTTRYLSNTGASNNPAWAQVDLSTGVTGILPVSNFAASGAVPLFTRRITRRSYVGSDNASANADGLNITEAGTGTASTAIQVDTTGYWRRHNTGATSGSRATAWSTGTGDTWLDSNVTFEARIRTGSSIADCRYWIGLFSASPTNADTITGRVAAFRFSTVAGDTSWTTVLRDNTTTTVGSAVGSIAANTQYLLRIAVSGSGTTATFQVYNGVTFASLGSSAVAIPAAALGANLFWALLLFNTNSNDIYFDHKAITLEND